MAGPSKKVLARAEWVLRIMQKRAEKDARDDGYFYRTDYWHRLVLDEALSDETQRLEHLTDPQLRRVLKHLEAMGKIQSYGAGVKHWKAITLSEKLEGRRRESQLSAWNTEVTDRLKASPLRGLWAACPTWGFTMGDMGEAMRDLMVAIDAEYGPNKRVIAIPPQVALAVAEMLEDFPGIAAQYFDFLETQVEDEDDGTD